MYYLNLDDNDYLLSISTTEISGPTINSLDGFDFSGYRINAYKYQDGRIVLDEQKLTELTKAEEERLKVESEPTVTEQLRADVDFLLIMGGYDI